MGRLKITNTQLQKIIKEARMAEYGYQDAAAGRPPSKVGRRDAEYMAAYEDEKENQISSREEKFGDALSAMGKGGLNEVTQGEMEFQGLEDARRAYLEDKNDDTRHELGNMINKLVEPMLAKLGFFWQAESYYSGGQIVFESFDPRIDITIDPVGKMGRYDVGIHPMDEELKFNPIQMSVDTMKGALQLISDTLGEQGMVGEPEAQTELPLGRRGISRLPKWRRTAKEHKTRITKSQLQQVIREEVKKLKESSSRFEVELFMQDVAQGYFRDGLDQKSVEAGLIEFFMDKIDGPEHPIADYQWFLKSLAREPEQQVDDDAEALRFKNVRRTSEPQRTYSVENKMRITKSQLQQIIREEFEVVAAAPRQGGGLLEAAISAYHELAEWLDNPNADENTGRVIDQLAAAINNAGGNV